MAVLTMTVDHQIYYSNKKRIPIKNVIKGLQAAESLIDELKPSIRQIFDGVDIKEINVYIEKLESGSLKEDLVIDMVFGGDAEYQKFRQRLVKIRGKVFNDKNDSDEKKFMKQLIALILAAGIGIGVTWAIMSDSNTVPKPINNYTTNITNSVIGVGDGALTGQNIVDIVSANSDKKIMAKAAVDFIKPAKDDPTASIQIDDNKDLTIKPSFVKNTPTTFTPPQPDEKIDAYTNVEVHISASNERSHRQGWKGEVRTILDTPTKIILSDDLDPKKLHGNINIKADLSIIKKYNASKKDYEVKEILIKKWTI